MAAGLYSMRSAIFLIETFWKLRRRKPRARESPATLRGRGASFFNTHEPSVLLPSHSEQCSPD
jgi:hypothetical protein